MKYIWVWPCSACFFYHHHYYQHYHFDCHITLHHLSTFEFDLARLVATSAFLTAPQPLQIPSSARKSNSNTNTDTKQIQTMNLKKREKSFGFHKNKQRATHPPRSGCPLAKSGAEPGRLTVLIQILHSCRNFLSMFSFCRLNLFLLWSWQRIVLPYRSVCEG